MFDTFSIKMSDLTSLQLSLIKEHCPASRLLKEIGAMAEDKCVCKPGEEWIVMGDDEYMAGKRSVGDFDMISFLILIGVKKDQILR